MAARGTGARRAAVALLHGVLVERRMLSELTAGAGAPLARLAPAERARAQALALGVLRNLTALDAVLAAFLDRPPPPKAQHALRVAAFELLVEGAPAHGVVNAAVEILRGGRRGGHLAGLVNAVARRLADEGAELWQAQPPQPLPGWLAKPVARHFGAAAVTAIAAAHRRGAAVDLSLKAPGTAAEWARRLAAEILPTGSLRLRGPAQVSALPGFAEGAWWVQDAAAAVPVRLLGDVAGQEVLDLCAAPGGKTMQLAAAGARVSALDISEPRLRLLRQNLERTGLAAEVVVADALGWRPGRRFDAIVLDAPCSATGTIRRHPDLPFVKAGTDLSGLFALQAGLIDAALELLKPGGRLIYCTCSLLPREGESQVEAALTRHPGLAVLPPDAPGMGLEPGWVTAEGGVRLRPDYWAGRGGMDGFYIAALRAPEP